MSLIYSNTIKVVKQQVHKSKQQKEHKQITHKYNLITPNHSKPN